MDERLKDNMRFLCDESRMLTGVTVAYGTPVHSEWTQYGRAQELTRTGSGFLPAVRPLQPDTIYDLASLTKLFTAVVTLALVESGRLSLDEFVGQIDPRFAGLRHVTVGDVLGFRVSLQTPGRIDVAPSREAGLSRLFAMSICPTPAIRVYSDMNAMAIKYIIEAKTGMSLFEAIRTWILSPAGMQETFAVVPEALRSHCVCYNYEHRIEGNNCILRTDVPCGAIRKPCFSATAGAISAATPGCSPPERTWFALRRRCSPANCSDPKRSAKSA